MAQGNYGSKIDLSNAYFQKRVHPDDVKFNTSKTPFGGFTSQVMMQGDMNAAASFVIVIENLFHDEFGKFIWIYINNMFIFSNSFEERIEHVQHACKKLKEHKFYAYPKKIVFSAAKLDILGHMIEDKGIHPAPAKIRNIMD